MTTLNEKEMAFTKATQELLETGGFEFVMGATLAIAENLLEALVKSKCADMDGQDITISAPSGRMITFHKMGTTFDDEMTH